MTDDSAFGPFIEELRSGPVLSALMEMTQDFVVLVSPEGEVLFTNRLEEGRDDPRGGPAMDFLKVESAVHFQQVLQGSVSDGQPRALRLMTNLGTALQVRLRPLHRNGVVEAVLATGTDVRVEDDLSAREASLAMAREAAGFGLWDWDVVRDRTSWDVQTKAIYGFSPDYDLTFQEIEERTHPADRDRVRQHIEGALATGRFSPIELRIETKTGTRWILSVGRVLQDAGGRPVRLLGGLLDVSEQRVRRARETEDARLEAMGRLAGGIAHDFNNLLLAIQANLDLARGAEPDPEALEEAQASVWKAAELTRGLLAFCRRSELRREAVDLQDVVKNTLTLVCRLLPAHVTVTFEGGERIPVFGDRSQLEQVVLNLCLNGRDAMMPTGGALRIACGPADPTILARQGLPGAPTALLEVEDAGRGIPPEHLAYVFEPFFSTNEGSSGLGLATVHGIVQRHGGAVRVESAQDRGTVFRVFLPLLDQLQPEPPPRISVPESIEGTVSKRWTVLLAEDEAGVRRGLTRILRRAGLEVLSAETGDEAIGILDDPSQRIDVAVVDAVMPGASGADVARRLRETRPGVPAILSSGYVDSLAGEAEGASMFSAFLPKPYASNELLEAIWRVMDDPASEPTAQGPADASE